MKAAYLIFFCILFVSIASSDEPSKPPVVVKIHSDVRYQTVNGWEATAQMGQDFPFFKRIQDQIVDLAVNDLGLTRLRLGIRASIENNHLIVEDPSRRLTHEELFAVKNDNGSPNKINWDGFQFAKIDQQIEEIILPFRKALIARGENLYLNVCYVNFGVSFLHRDHPDEYAELMLAVFLHMQQKYGFVPDAIEIILEPDNAKWNGKQIGKNMVATGKLLQARGFHPDFIAPSTMDASVAARYFDQMIEVPGVTDFLKEFSYHRYRNIPESAQQEIISRAQKYQLRTSMLEFIGANAKLLHDDLKDGLISAWEQYTVAYPITKDSQPGGAYYQIDATDQSNPIVKPGRFTGQLRQYFRYIRPGAIRVQAESNDPNFEPLAFINRNDKYVVVIRTSAPGYVLVDGLPTGEYASSFASKNQTSFSEEPVPYNYPLIVTSKGTGVLTIFQK